MWRFPVTSLALIVSIVLFLAVFDYDRTHRNDRLGGLSHYGAVTNLQRVGDPELYGPFQLWDGDWWRVLATGFHHADLLHLAGNAIFLVYLGRLLESRIGSGRLFVFLLLATPISLIPPLLFGDAVVGLSGGIYAMFGILFVMRRHDYNLQYLIPDRIVQMALLWIPIGIVLSALSIMPISNLGHAAGLAYGCAAGWVFYSPTGRRLWYFRPVFYAAHLAVIPAMTFVMQPDWNGRYHWYLAMKDDTELPDRIAELELAVERDPQLGGAWRELAEAYRRDGDYGKMWEALFNGMLHNRSDRELPEQIANYWQRSGPEQRKEALHQLRNVFGEEADDWRNTLGLKQFAVATTVPRPPVAPAFWPLSDERPAGVPQPLSAPPVDPNAPGSAEEGVGL